MKRSVFRILCVTFFSLIFIVCNKTDSNPVNNNPALDDISNQWTSESDNNYTFTFTSFDKSVVRGIFWGNENHPTEGNTDLCGFFDRAYIEFDVKRPFGDRIKFKGTIINNGRIELSSVEGSVVITR